MLEAGIDGIVNKIDPGDPIEADIYSMSEEERRGKKLVGILSFNDYPEYTEEYAKIIAACRKAKKG